MKIIVGAIAVCVVAGAGLLLCLARRPAPRPPLSPVYVASGYGGFRSAEKPPAQPAAKEAGRKADPVAPVEAAYKAGDYKKVDAVGDKVIRTASKPVAARTKLVMAYAAARRKDMSLARDRFAEVKHDASAVPHSDTPKVSRSGEPEANLEEEAAYQHAVCTAALGEKDEAEKEYVAFMKAYPESPLVHAAVKRVARFHGGNIPAEANSVWKQAMKTAQARDKIRQKERSMCGPECLAEALSRLQPIENRKSKIENLAREMGTDENGTTLQALIDAARKRGFDSRGLKVTQKGLESQSLPLIALVLGSHFVLVEKIGPEGVRVWNPEGNGVGKPAQAYYKPAEWAKAWDGIVVTLDRQ